MELEFYKYQATANDFIMINAFNQDIILSESQINFLCHRRFGVGADGLIILKKSDNSDFKMEYYNSDGKLATMCGNGGRCISLFAKNLGIADSGGSFHAADGIHSFKIQDNIIELSMTEPEFFPDLDTEKFIDTGSPHHIEIVKSVDMINVNREGELIRNDIKYLEIGGTNVNFVEVKSSNKLAVRTYERGVENETYSCGTGVVASAIISHKMGLIKSNKVSLITKGGELKVEFNDSYSNVLLIGEAKYVFNAKISI
jgi:diaminopimelate epimerase